MKRIVLLSPNGSEHMLTKPPTFDEMRMLLDGLPERVAVMDRLRDHEIIVYTAMFVNKDGLRLDLPRNPRATEIYQRNVRHQFRDFPDPFHQANEVWRRRHGLEVVDTPKHALERGYKKDPWIAGPAIYFEGWVLEDVDRIY